MLWFFIGIRTTCEVSLATCVFSWKICKCSIISPLIFLSKKSEEQDTCQDYLWENRVPRSCLYRQCRDWEVPPGEARGEVDTVSSNQMVMSNVSFGNDIRLYLFWTWHGEFSQEAVKQQQHKWIPQWQWCGPTTTKRPNYQNVPVKWWWLVTYRLDGRRRLTFQYLWPQESRKMEMYIFSRMSAWDPGLDSHHYIPPKRMGSNHEV